MLVILVVPRSRGVFSDVGGRWHWWVFMSRNFYRNGTGYVTSIALCAGDTQATARGCVGVHN